MPKFEANMNYILPSPPSSMKQCNKSATVKFHMELLLTTTTRKQSRSGATPRVELIAKGYKFYIGLYSPCKGSYVLNQFPSNVMFGMNGFHVSVSGAIQGHHGPLVLEGQNGVF